MSQLSRTLYTKCHQSDLKNKSLTLSDTGLFTKYFFTDPHKLSQQMSLREDEVVIKVSIEGFAVDNPQFKCFDDGVFENNSPIFMKYVTIA